MNSNTPYQNTETTTTQLKYCVIKSDEQYYEYCNELELLDSNENPSDYELIQIELLCLLIKEYDSKTRFANKPNPIEVIKSLMQVNNLNQSEIAAVCGVGKGYMSEVLNGKKDISKSVMRRISKHFAVSQDILNP